MIATAIVCFQIYPGQTFQELRDSCTMVAKAIETSGRDQIITLRHLDQTSTELRFSLISPEKVVLYDTVFDGLSTENLRTHAEIAAALRRGEGESRYQTPKGEEMFYYAMLLPDGSILRAACLAKSMEGFFAPLLPYASFAFMVILFLALGASGQLAAWICRPIDKLGEKIESANYKNIEYYDELAPLMNKLIRQDDELAVQARELRQDRSTLRTMTRNMREGMIIVNMNRTVLSSNAAAQKLLGAESGEYGGKNIVTLSRNTQFISTVAMALDGRANDLLVEIHERACHNYASPIYKDGILNGAMVLVVDQTEQQKAEKVRRDFSANVSHELKTPLTSISGYAEMLENGMAHTAKDVRLFASRISREAARLLSLIEDIIRLSKLDERMGVTLTKVDAAAVCREITSSLQPLANTMNVALSCEGAPAPVLAGQGMLSELITNLCDNAIKYNKPGGSVIVRTLHESGMVRLIVEDTGIGIAGEHCERIFERFYRVDKSRSKQTGGTGLGLSICKHIVEYLGGDITVESTPGVGTKITVTLKEAA